MRAVSITALAAAIAGSGSARAAAVLQSHPSPPSEQTWRDLASPSALTPAEESRTAGATLARRYNPAMAFVHKDIWPVPLRYAWADGAGLMARVMDNQNRAVREYEALPHHRLAADDWGDLPNTDNEGRSIQYFVDAPGDDRIEQGVSNWRRRWRAIMTGDPLANAAPSALDYAPTQHAHVSWFNRDKGLLALEYWFYYPYNEWINHHEGDWEHITVILRGPSRLTSDVGWRPVGYLFFFHEFVDEPKQVVRVGGADPREDHVLVYVGGKSRFLRWQVIQSGASYPLPSLYPAVGGGITGLRADEDVNDPARFIRPEEFAIVMLPEPDRLDVGLHPELTWLRLDFFAGQAVMFQNPLALNGMGFGSPPRQPARQAQWNHNWFPLVWAAPPPNGRHAMVNMPEGWKPLSDAPFTDEPQVSARRSQRMRAASKR